jgi:AcrR family transcriptional regulator
MAPTRRRGRPRLADAPAALDEILVAALHAFAVHGYDGVSVRTLNKELGASHNLLHQRFGSKEAIWYAAVDHGFGGLLAELADSLDPTNTDPLDQLRVTIRRFLLYSAEHPDICRLMNTEGCLDTPRLDYLFARFIQPATAPLAAMLADLVTQGRVRPISLVGLQALITSGGAAVFTQVALVRHFDPDGPLDPGFVTTHVDVVAELIVAGLKIGE